MAKKLYLSGTISVGHKGKKIKLGAGTDVEEISWPDKKYGLKEADLERMLGNGTASFEGVSIVSPEKQINITVDQARMGEFAKALAQLNAENPDHWTNEGAPDVAALKEVGLEASADERDAVWDILKNFQ